MRLAFVAPALLAIVACTTTPSPHVTLDADGIRRIIDSPIRTEQDRRMDARRLPVELLRLTQVAPGMQVLDVAAGAGYTSQLLALAVGPGGKVWAQRVTPGAALTKRLEDQPQANLVVTLRPYESPVPEGTPKLDLVTLIFNYHDITYQPIDRAKMNRSIFDALKPGGRYVILDHSAKPGSDVSSGKSLHRIDEALVIDEVQKAGFVLDGRSDAWRDPKDSREQSSGDSAMLTDRFALRFVKR